MMRAISVCSRSTIDFGVPAGNSTPWMVSASWFLIPSSSSVGTSGKAGERVAAVTASARNLRSYFSGPARARENADEIGISRGSVEDQLDARRERKGTKNRGMVRKTTEKTADDSPSVHGRAYVTVYKRPGSPHLAV